MDRGIDTDALVSRAEELLADSHRPPAQPRRTGPYAQVRASGGGGEGGGGGSGDAGRSLFDAGSIGGGGLLELNPSPADEPAQLRASGGGGMLSAVPGSVRDAARASRERRSGERVRMSNDRSIDSLTPRGDGGDEAFLTATPRGVASGVGGEGGRSGGGGLSVAATPPPVGGGATPSTSGGGGEMEADLSGMGEEAAMKYQRARLSVLQQQVDHYASQTQELEHDLRYGSTVPPSQARTPRRRRYSYRHR